MAKQKVSATISPDRLREAQRVTGCQNVSEVLDLALEALVERELERRWLAAHAQGEPLDLPGEVPVDLRALPWDDPS